jgi:hypothetical protein
VRGLQREEVTARYHSDQTALGHQDDMADAMARHLENGLERERVRLESHERRRHDGPYRCRRRVAALGHDLSPQVAVGDDADRAAVLGDHDDRPDPFTRETPRHIDRGDAERARHGWALDQVAHAVQEE